MMYTYIYTYIYVYAYTYNRICVQSPEIALLYLRDDSKNTQLRQIGSKSLESSAVMVAEPRPYFYWPIGQ